MNGDGLDDVIVGAPRSHVSGSQTGQSYVVFGKADTKPIELADVVNGQGGFAMNGVEGTVHAGGSVDVCDLNLDGLADAVIGARHTVFVVLGKADGTTVELEDVRAGVGGIELFGAEKGSSIWSVACAGDVDDDGLPDLVFGDPDADPGGLNNAGEAHVVFNPFDGNDNDVIDEVEIANGTSTDVNGNGLPDECECLADVDGSGGVGTSDLLELLASWGPVKAGHPADFDGDSVVGPEDLGALLANWGPCF